MATIIGRGKPQGFSLIPEGEQNVRITDVKSASSVQSVGGRRVSTVSEVTVYFANADGDKFNSRYNLAIDGGYAAFYYLVLNGLGIDISEGEFDVNELIGHYVIVDLVHRQGTKPKDDGTFATFVNIKRTIGQGTAFGEVEEEVDADDEDLFA